MPSSLRSTQEMTATRCSCGGRKSLPVFVRRIWNATSATSRSGRSAGRPCSRADARDVGNRLDVEGKNGVINPETRRSKGSGRRGRR